ncbi:hypothetical protein QUF31_07550 [Dickeya chrysanthemi]|uniref:hypothetical protein n=1 Tax=Dickeya TaxID=204037 RepID=UPI00117CA81C|nr:MULTISPECIES: hypothetical protein [Dickeya]TYL41100.1 hypothetical protein FDP13_19595 [Dickeya sp. ws52]WJM86941.1 hypothetical protein QUF31_07550 [Dickeya chrysanthemi]
MQITSFGVPSPSFMAGYDLTNTTGTASVKKRRENNKEQGAFLVPSKSSEVINEGNSIIKTEYTIVILITKQI